MGFAPLVQPLQPGGRVQDLVDLVRSQVGIDQDVPAPQPGAEAEGAHPRRGDAAQGDDALRDRLVVPVDLGRGHAPERGAGRGLGALFADGGLGFGTE